MAGLVVAGPVGLGILWILHEIKLNGFEIIGLLKTKELEKSTGRMIVCVVFFRFCYVFLGVVFSSFFVDEFSSTSEALMNSCTSATFLP